jgi:hypothetical protein
MADTKITALSALTAADPANDVLPIVDVNDPFMAASGTTKKISINNILGASGTATLASATITGDLTVDTSTLKVDSANNRVGVVTATPAYPLDVVGVINTNSEIYATGGRLALYRTAGASYLDHASGQDLIFRTVTSAGGAGPSELMRLNSTGLGVGASPNISASGKALTISGAFTRSRLELQNTDGGTAGVTCGTISWFNGSNAIADITGATNSGSATLGSLAFSTGGSPRLTIDSSGNVGVGVSPANDKILSLGSMGILLSGATSDFSFRNSGGTAIQRLRYTDATGTLTIGSATGTAYPVELGGNTTTRAVTIDASNNLILQSSATPATLTVNGQLTVNATSNTNLRFSYRGSDGTTRVADITLA